MAQVAQVAQVAGTPALTPRGLRRDERMLARGLRQESAGSSQAFGQQDIASRMEGVEGVEVRELASRPGGRNRNGALSRSRSRGMPLKTVRPNVVTAAGSTLSLGSNQPQPTPLAIGNDQSGESEGSELSAHALQINGEIEKDCISQVPGASSLAPVGGNADEGVTEGGVDVGKVNGSDISGLTHSTQDGSPVSSPLGRLRGRIGSSDERCETAMAFSPVAAAQMTPLAFKLSPAMLPTTGSLDGEDDDKATDARTGGLKLDGRFGIEGGLTMGSPGLDALEGHEGQWLNKGSEERHRANSDGENIVGFAGLSIAAPLAVAGSLSLAQPLSPRSMVIARDTERQHRVGTYAPPGVDLDASTSASTSASDISAGGANRANRVRGVSASHGGDAAASILIGCAASTTHDARAAAEGANGLQGLRDCYDGDGAHGNRQHEEKKALTLLRERRQQQQKQQQQQQLERLGDSLFRRQPQLARLAEVPPASRLPSPASRLPPPASHLIPSPISLLPFPLSLHSCPLRKCACVWPLLPLRLLSAS